jgi:hypothetical protein
MAKQQKFTSVALTIRSAQFAASFGTEVPVIQPEK